MLLRIVAATLLGGLPSLGGSVRGNRGIRRGGGYWVAAKTGSPVVLTRARAHALLLTWESLVLRLRSGGGVGRGNARRAGAGGGAGWTSKGVSLGQFPGGPRAVHVQAHAAVGAGPPLQPDWAYPVGGTWLWGSVARSTRPLSGVLLLFLVTLAPRAA